VDHSTIDSKMESSQEASRLVNQREDTEEQRSKSEIFSVLKRKNIFLKVL